MPRKENGKARSESEKREGQLKKPSLCIVFMGKRTNNAISCAICIVFMGKRANRNRSGATDPELVHQEVGPDEVPGLVHHEVRPDQAVPQEEEPEPAAVKQEEEPEPALSGDEIGECDTDRKFPTKSLCLLSRKKVSRRDHRSGH